MSFEEAKKLDDHFVMHTFARKPVLLVEGSGMEVKTTKAKPTSTLLLASA